MVQALWVKDLLLGHSRTNAEADGGQQVSATSPNNVISSASADLQMLQNYTEQPASETIQMTVTA